MTTKVEHHKAKAWRLRHGWTMEQLSDLTGYSVSSVVWMERGQSSVGKPVEQYAWQRYRLVCAAVDAEQDGRKAFRW